MKSDCGPYGTPRRVAIDLGSVSFGLVQDVDLFGVSEEHLGSEMKGRSGMQSRDGPSLH